MSDDFEAQAREAFREESSDMLAALERSLSQLATASGPACTALADEAFRAVHTLKGSAGIFDLRDLAALAHDTETALDGVRQSGRADDALVGLLFEAHDLLSRLCQAQAVAPAALALLQQRLQARPGVHGPAPDPVEAQARGPASAAATTAAQDDGALMRVRSGRLDALIDSMADLTGRMGGLAASVKDAALLERLSDATQALVRTRDQALALRMVSVLEVFARFPRLVREVSRQSGKQVELLVDDGGAEIDRTLVEAVADPLLHLVRNAIDHGLEDAATRRAAGKPATGHLQLRAARDGDALVFEVRDDGRGLDRQRIRERAIERGLISGTQALSDEELHRLVCTPGFSTAATVSDLSGRGVGMDVVKSRIEALRGELLIRSEPGRGTQMILRVPMTLAQLDAYLAQAGSGLCAVPADAVVECLDAPEALADGTLSWRGQWLPAVYLGSMFGAAPAAEPGAMRRHRRSALVVRSEERHMALVVDRIVRRQPLLVRPLDPLMADCRAFNGCAVLDDGRVALLLQLQGLAVIASAP